MRAEELFHSALERPPVERHAFLIEACQGDTALIAEARALLDAHERAGDFLDPELSPEVAAEMERLKPEIAGDRIGPYKLLQQIGAGGFGAVWMAEQEQPVRRRVALKIIKLGMDTKEVIARFEQERQALAMMDHPNIAKVFDAGTTPQGRPFFVMELVRGLKITQYCDQHSIGMDERLRLFMQVCRAVQHAHQKGIIHRDLKPSNVLVTNNDGVAVPKVIDFGLVKATQARLTDLTLFTQFERFIGTPAYMSPEQAEMTSLDVDTRSDIYSLGVLLYELLTGHTPLDAKTLMERGYDEMRRAIRECDPPLPSTRLSSLGGEELTLTAQRRHIEPARLSRAIRGDLDWIVMKCLEKSRARRYETASGVALDIERHLANEPIVARPPTTVYRFKKLVLRNKLAVAAGSIVVGAVLLGATVAFWQFLEKSAALREQSRLRADAEKAQRREEMLRLQAERSDKAARQLGYATTISVVWNAWDYHFMPQARSMLARTEPRERGFEWFYLQRMMHLNPNWDESALSRKLPPEHGGAKHGAFSRDGSRLVTIGEESLTIWEIATWNPIGTLPGGAAVVTRVTFSPDGKCVATAHTDGTAKLWEVSTGREIRVLRGHAAALTGIAFTNQAQQIVTSSVDGTIRTWDASTGNETGRITHIGPVTDIAVSPDGRYLATCSADALARLWDLEGKRELLQFVGHAAAVDSVLFSPDGKRLLTASADETARLWNVNTGTLILTLRGHKGPVLTASFSPDQRRIVTSGSDGYIRIWHPENGLELLCVGPGKGVIPWASFTPDNGSVVLGYPGPLEVWESASVSQVTAWEKEDDDFAGELERNERGGALATRSEYLFEQGRELEASAAATDLLRFLRTEKVPLAVVPADRLARLASNFLSRADDARTRGDTPSAAAHDKTADEFLTPFMRDPVPADEETFALWVKSADVFIQAKQQSHAAMLLSRLHSARPKNIVVPIALAAVLIELGETGKYLQLRKELLAEFSGSTDVKALRIVPKLVCLRPVTGSELEAATQLMRQCEAYPHSEAQLPWLHLSQGIVALRQGEHRTAVDMLRACLAAGGSDGCQRAAHALLALSLHALSEIDQARDALDAGKKTVRHSGSVDAPRDWLIADILLREAESTLAR
jgi:serine/threonine protein kinase/WD40 repeat protein/tetratricopeptide (TPR) repeat protein